ncbi:P-loop containing nucleoside triphosphate hydrolase protein [Lentinula aff. detonsa]|uniref:P-loop containing nucleoside triphosphate hydrolase protein n=1 Tax=Lentinula aff. detonsa TaxID=2804958 RepID=A0AA38U7H4_9AGAR|nr:P-loop containing nucleoside triphosphate hydrolase protein [Lentinula aff. detonsa]KAJ3803101.1 P-loop containing nucleoside triphosphate hydrolase protein [Lentinula aff. detonsa]
MSPAQDIIMQPSQSIETQKIRWPVHVEVRLKSRSTSRFDSIRTHVHAWITAFDRINLSSSLDGWEDVPELAASVERIVTSESSCPFQSLPVDEMALQIHVYQPCDSDAFEEFSNSNSEDDDETMAATVRELPNRSWEGLWNSLIYEDNIKMKLLDYIHATLVLSDAEVDFNLVSWNRVVLLHGPPGTGKTSLCRALAQKLSIRLSQRYSHARLLEINSHSLFSKWFSESGKLVQRLFSSISELADEEDAFLVVLIDEVESLTAARASAMAGTEPSDGLRVVNALLTQLDKLKHRKNVLVMSTSNLVKAIDSAFVDRADIVQYIDLPPREAVYEILRTCLCEIINRGIVSSIDVPSLQQALMYERTAPSQTSTIISDGSDAHEKSEILGLRLLALATQCRAQKMSGRALRRLPVLALARYISAGSIISPDPPEMKGRYNVNGSSTRASIGTSSSAEVDTWLSGMESVVTDQGRQRECLL